MTIDHSIASDNVLGKSNSTHPQGTHMDIKPRRMLLLQSSSSLTQEESWLRKAYFNIVKNLVEFAINPSPTFDPFSTKFMGLESIERNKHQYRAFMEVTSYFWGSKGGRGALGKGGGIGRRIDRSEWHIAFTDTGMDCFNKK